jgi:proline dehydrogenase
MRADRAILFKLATNERFEQLVKALPGGEQGAYRAASKYVAGRTRDEALSTAAHVLGQGHGVSIDLFGELSTSTTEARRVADDYLQLVERLPEPPADVWLSVDLSHFALDVDPDGAAVEPRGAHPYGEPTDVAFLRLAHQLAEAGTPWSLATHDGRLCEAVLLSTGQVSVEQLLGVRPETLDDLHARSVPTRVYLPYGPDWFRYWLRRIAESRGA